MPTKAAAARLFPGSSFVVEDKFLQLQMTP